MNDKLKVISSSSAGNCYIYNQELMVDIGVAFNKIKPYLKDIKVILLTHWHFDHFNLKTLKKCLYERPTIKIVCGEFMVQRLVDNGIDKSSIFVLKLDKTYDLGKYIITPVMAVHDVPNFGYKITIKKDNYKIFHITDTSCLDNINAKDFEMYSIEANYDEELLEQHIRELNANGDTENKLYYLNRVKQTHLSSQQATNFLLDNMSEISQYIFLHKSLYNNKEEENEKEIS